jgi:PIN domain nuclease of toxin-antitoxin system
VKYLLDTHIWVWALIEPGRLSSDVRAVLADPDHELWLSSISVWEVLVLARKGRLRLIGDPQRWVDTALSRAPVREAPLTHEIARESERLVLDYWDPADRFIAATSRVIDATLITADLRLIGISDIKVLANR